MTDLKWIVYVFDQNKREIQLFNIFDHYRFRESCNKAWSKHKDNFAMFSEDVKSDLMYYFWSKYEWEIMLSGLFTMEKYKQKKIDVYDQVILNWDAFIKYTWTTFWQSERGERNEHSSRCNSGRVD